MTDMTAPSPTASVANAKRYPQCMMATCCIPWLSDWTLDEPTFRASIRHNLAHGTKHLYLYGTAGEGYALTEAQFERITRIFIEEMRAAEAEPMIGLISTSQSQMVERLEKAADWGVRKFQISLPCWGTCDRHETHRFFEATCGTFPELSFLHYNVRRCGRLIGAAEYGELAATFANLVAIKHTGDSVAELVALRRQALPVRLLLTERTFAAAALLGLEPGFLVSFASMNWELARAYHTAGVTRDHARLHAMVMELDELAQILVEAMDEPRIDGAYDQMFAKLHLPRFALRLLPPYQAATEATFQAFAASVAARQPQWAQSWMSHVKQPRVASADSHTHFNRKTPCP